MTYDQWKLATPPNWEPADRTCSYGPPPDDDDDGDRADDAHEREGDR